MLRCSQAGTEACMLCLVRTPDMSNLPKTFIRQIKHSSEGWVKGGKTKRNLSLSLNCLIFNVNLLA